MTQANALLASEAAEKADRRPVRRARPAGMRRDLAFPAMVFPGVVLFTLLFILPTFIGLFYSFTNYAGFGRSEWIGFGNYVALFGDPQVWGAYGFTFFLAILAVIVVNVCGMAIALGLNARIKWRTGIRTIFFIPMVLSGLVVSYVFTYLFGNTLPAISESVGFAPLAQTMLANEATAWIPILIVTAWTSIPGTTLIYLAGLQAVPTEIYEAAKVDGASAWRQFLSLTLPLLFGYLAINFILGFRGYLGAYEIILAMTGGGPGSANTTVAMRIFGGLQAGDFAFQAANAVIFFLITMIISLTQAALVRKRGTSL